MSSVRSVVGDVETAFAASLRESILAARARAADNPTCPAAAPAPTTTPDPSLAPEPEPVDPAVQALVDLARAGYQAPRRGKHTPPAEVAVAVAAVHALMADLGGRSKTFASALVAEALGVSDKAVLNWVERAAAVEAAYEAGQTPAPRVRPVVPFVSPNAGLTKESAHVHFQYEH